MARTAFIVGGTGQIGIATAGELLRRGWQVTLAHRGRHAPQNCPAGATLVRLDRRDTAALREALTPGVDALVDTVAFTGADAAQLLDLAGHYGSLAVISSAGIYEDAAGRSLETAGTLGFPEFDGPRRETDRTVAPGPDSYSSAKVELEQRLCADTMRPVTILRPCAIHGINSLHPREWWFVKRMLDGRRAIPLAGGGDARFHTTATVNLAALIATALDAPATRILNAGDPYAPSVRDIGEAIAAELGWDGRFVATDPAGDVGQTPWSVAGPFTISMAAAQALGYAPAGSYAETIRPYVAWLRGHADDWQTAFPTFRSYPSDPFAYAPEDAVL